MKFVKVDKNKNIFTITLETNKITTELLHSLLNNRRNKKDFKLINTYKFEDESVEVYGYKIGEEKNINKLELIDNDELLYDDLVFCVKNDNDDYLDFVREEFQDFYESLFDGFEDLDNSDEEFEQDEDYDYSDGFVINDL